MATPSAGDWSQIQSGLKLSFQPKERRHWTLRTGVVWLRAAGEPNLLDEPGDYGGFYVGGGFEAEITEHLTVGPAVVLMPVFMEGSQDLELVPQLTWRFIWRL